MKLYYMNVDSQQNFSIVFVYEIPGIFTDMTLVVFFNSVGSLIIIGLYSGLSIIWYLLSDTIISTSCGSTLTTQYKIQQNGILST